MGLLTAMLQRKWQQQDQQARAQGIMDVMGGQNMPQMMGPPTEAGAMQAQPGAGIFSTSPQQQMQAMGQIMALPGMEQSGAGMINQALQRQQQQQQWEGLSGYQQAQLEQAQQMSPYQQAMIDIRKMELERAAQQQGQWTPADILEATTKQQTQAMKQLAPTRGQLQQFAAVTDTVNQSGGFEQMTGADDLQMITAFSKMMRPNEAVMSDDVQNVLRTLGYGDMINSLLGAAKGKQLTPTQREQVYATMQTMGQQAMQQNAQMRQMIGARLGGTPVQPGQVMPPLIQFNPYAPQPAAGQGGLMGSGRSAPPPPPGFKEY